MNSQEKLRLSYLSTPSPAPVPYLIGGKDYSNPQSVPVVEARGEPMIVRKSLPEPLIERKDNRLYIQWEREAKARASRRRLRRAEKSKKHLLPRSDHPSKRPPIQTMRARKT